MTSRSPDPDRLPGPRPQSEALFESASHRVSGGWGNLVTGQHSFNGDRPDLVETAWFEQTRFVLDAITELRSELSLDGAGPRA